MLGQSHLKVSSGITYRLSITGYDPRDLVYGHYLLFRFATLPLERQWGSQDGELYCFNGQEETFQVREVSSSQRRECQAWISKKKLDQAHRYLIPEAESVRLEQRFRSSRAEVDVIIQPEGSFTFGQLYLDGQPWQDLLRSGEN